MGIILDFLRERLENRFQSAERVQGYRMQPFSAEKSRPVALFGASPDGFALDYVTYRTAKPQGPGTQPLQTESKEFDADVEKWKGPNPNIPSLVPHGRRLDYSHAATDQRPPVGHSVTPGDKPITLDAVEPRKDFQALRNRHEPTPGDQAALDLKRYPYDLSI